MARLILSAGMFSALASRMALRSRGFLSGSPPPDLAAMLISRIRRVKILPRLASRAPFLCLMVAHFEWPDIGNLAVSKTQKQSQIIACWKTGGSSRPVRGLGNFALLTYAPEGLLLKLLTCKITKLPNAFAGPCASPGTRKQPPGPAPPRVRPRN